MRVYLVVGVPVVPREPVPACAHKIRLPFGVHLACFKCRIKRWGIDNLCSNEERCRQCINEPGYIFAQITEKIVQGQKRSQQRARHRERGKQNQAQNQVRAAEKDWEARRRQQVAQTVLNQMPLGGPHAQAAQQDLFPAPHDQPSATSTPRHEAEEDALSFHASDFLSPAGVDQDITFVSIDEVMNATDIADALTPSGRHMYRQGTTEV